MIGLLLAVSGSLAWYRLRAVATPVEVTCREFAESRPSEAWVRIRGCAMDYLGAGYREADGTIVELFFPVRPTGAAPTEPAALVAATRDPAVLAIAQSGIGGGRQPNQEQFLLMMLKIVTALGASREITGVVRTGVVERLRTRRVLSGLTTALSPDAVVLDVNATRGTVFPAVQTALGVLLVAGAMIRRRATRGAATVASVAAVNEPGGPAPVEPARVRGLLILNLGPGSGAEAIDQAPALGPRAEVVEWMVRTIDGIEFDARGRGRVRRGEHAVIVDIGLADPVPCAVAGADGVEGTAAVRRLLAAAAWRAYIPSTGRFW